MLLDGKVYQTAKSFYLEACSPCLAEQTATQEWCKWEGLLELDNTSTYIVTGPRTTCMTTNTTTTTTTTATTTIATITATATAITTTILRNSTTTELPLLSILYYLYLV